jgi:hypothetical protein
LESHFSKKGIQVYNSSTVSSSFCEIYVYKEFACKFCLDSK